MKLGSLVTLVDKQTTIWRALPYSTVGIVIDQYPPSSGSAELVDSLPESKVYFFKASISYWIPDNDLKILSIGHIIV